jgi:hypothetical protein
MIKRYNQFIKENDEFMEEPSFEETEGRLAEEDLEQEPIQSEEAGEEEEAGDIYTNRLKELAEKLGTEVVDGKIDYNGQTIIFPSETEMYHVGKKKFKTADEVVEFLEGSENKTQELPEPEEVAESKSYKNRFKI